MEITRNKIIQGFPVDGTSIKYWQLRERLAGGPEGLDVAPLDVKTQDEIEKMLREMCMSGQLEINGFVSPEPVQEWTLPIVEMTDLKLVNNIAPVIELQPNGHTVSINEIKMYPEGWKPENPEEFFDEENRLVPENVARNIMERFSIITFLEDQTMFRYIPEKGIYVANVEGMFELEIKKLIGSRFRTTHKKEVMLHVRSETVAPREKLEEKSLKYIHLANGIFDLSLGRLIDFDPSIFSLTGLPVIYDPKAECPKFQEFLKQVLVPKDIPNIQEFFGYCLYKAYPIHKAFMLIGEGSNGKSTLLTILKKFLGSENVANCSLQNLLENRFAIAELYGKLANVYADLSDRAFHETGTFKMLTGEDSIDAEQKFQQKHLKLTNYAKIISSCNKLPETKDNTDAFFRRWIIINFPNKFENEKADKGLLEKLTTPEELSGMLNWALEGLRRLLAAGHFSDMTSTEDMRRHYIKLSDSLQAFIIERIRVDPEGWVTKEQFMSEYGEYCRENDLMTKVKDRVWKEIYRHLKVEEERRRIGVEGSQVRGWRGIAFITTVNEDKNDSNINLSQVRHPVTLDKYAQNIDDNDEKGEEEEGL